MVYDCRSRGDRLAPYAGQGWGLAARETGYVMSDGTDMLQFAMPVSIRQAVCR